jgi:chromosome partitioning protein
MTLRVVFASQKGGVGKSALARSLAVVFAEADWRVLIADFDVEQLTCVGWQARRLANEIQPELEVLSFKSPKRMDKVRDRYDVVIEDGPGYADKHTATLASAAHAVFLPTGVTIDDLRPTLALADQLVAAGVKAKDIAIVLARTGRSERQEADARGYLRPFGYQVIGPTWPQKDGFAAALGSGRAGREAASPALRTAAEELDQAMLDFVASRKRFPRKLPAPRGRRA